MSRRSKATATLALASTMVLTAILLPGLGSADPATDPGANPIPLPDLDLGSKAVMATLNFIGDAEAEMTAAEVVFGPSHGKAGNPPLLRVTLSDYLGGFLTQYDEWDPRWVFGDGPAGEESLEVLAEAAGRFVVPFEPDLQFMEVFDLRSDQLVGTFDLGPAIRQFCEDHPTDPDCEQADLELVSGEIVDPPPLVVIGEPETMTLQLLMTNNGPDAPIDAVIDVSATADPELSIEPVDVSLDEPALGLNEERSRDQSYAVECLAPGLHTVTFTATIDALKPAVSDPDPSNNEQVVSLDVDCAVPVAINIKPGGDPNSVNRNAASVPVAVLTTEAGEYDLPLAFDASTIDPLSARFGPPDVAAMGGGADEIHDRGHLEDAFELDEQTTDGDLDMVLHFDPGDAGFALTDTEACVKGAFDGGGDAPFTFFGCGPVVIVK